MEKKFEVGEKVWVDVSAPYKGISRGKIQDGYYVWFVSKRYGMKYPDLYVHLEKPNFFGRCKVMGILDALFESRPYFIKEKCFNVYGEHVLKEEEMIHKDWVGDV